MTTYSDAAKEYASSRWQDGTIGWFEAAGDFDAGAAYDAPPLKAWERELLGAAPAPVLLTADDPRIRPGARVRWVRELHVVRLPQDAGAIDETSVPAVQNGCRSPFAGEAWYLIAEAPDPDADVVANLVCELVEIDDSREWTTVEARRILAVVRADS